MSLNRSLRDVKLSQVIVTEDKLSDKRKQSRDQEHRIKVESQLARWRRDDVTKPDPVKKIIGLLATPVLGIWAGLATLIVAAMLLMRAFLRGLGKIINGSGAETRSAPRS